MDQWYSEALQAARNKMNYQFKQVWASYLIILSKNTNHKRHHATGVHLNLETVEVQKGVGAEM